MLSQIIADIDSDDVEEYDAADADFVPDGADGGELLAEDDLEFDIGIDEDEQDGHRGGRGRARGRGRGRGSRGRGRERGRAAEPPSAEHVAAAAAATAEREALLVRRRHNQPFCTMCLDGGSVRPCDGPCMGAYHFLCLPRHGRPGVNQERWLCPTCTHGSHVCVLCGKAGTGVGAGGGSSSGMAGLHKCGVETCGLYWHAACLASLCPPGPPAGVSNGSGAGVEGAGGGLVCPAHFCHSCRGQEGQGVLQRCWLCPRAFHDSPSCLPGRCQKVPQSAGGGGWLWCPNCLAAHRQCCELAQKEAQGPKSLQWPACQPQDLKQRVR